MIENLAIKTDSKLVLLVIDGLGGVPKNEKTELEAANTPNLDNLASKSVTGVTDPISPGITPGSGPAHLSLFGYDPIKYQIGRGLLEALGVGISLGRKDLAARGNFCTVNDKGIVIDRRAGRISTEENKRICKRVQDYIKEIDGIKIHLTPGKEHRFVLVLSGEGLDERITETDPQKIGERPIVCEPLSKEANKTAIIINQFVDKVKGVLTPPANMVLLRGFAKYPSIPSMEERFKLTPAAIATYPMYKGLAKLVGMEILDTGLEIEDEVEALKKNWKRYDFFYVHIKKTDSLGEDGNFTGKIKLIEKVDKIIPELLSLRPDVLVVTGDHSTPAVLKAHSWHPNPFLLYSRWIIPDETRKFTERECRKGGLGRFLAIYAIPLMLANALKLKKYGA